MNRRLRLVLDTVKLLFSKKKIQKILNESTAITPKKVVINTIRNGEFISFVERFIAYMYAASGVTVYQIFDDGQYEHWDTYTITSNVENLNPSKIKKINFRWLIVLIIKHVFNHKNIKTIRISSILNETKDVDIDISEHENQAFSSTIRYYQTDVLDISKNGEHYSYYCKSLRNIEISVAVAKYLMKHYEPDIFLTSHGIYSLWGPQFNIMKSNGISTIVFGRHGYADKKMAFLDTLHQLGGYSKSFSHFRQNYEMTEQDDKVIEEYFESRFSHDATDTKFYYKDRKLSQVNRAGDKFQLVLFPNLIWDGNIKERNTIFSGLIEWIVSTVEYLKNTDEIQVIIRFHPAEATVYTDTVKLETLVRKELPNIDLYKNVTILSSDSDVDTYQLMKKSTDIGITYGGMVALELPFLNKPIIMCGKNRFCNTGISFEPATKQDYFDLIGNPEKVITDFNSNFEEIRRNLYLFSYWYLCELPIRFPGLSSKENLALDFSNFLEEICDQNMISDLKSALEIENERN